MEEMLKNTSCRMKNLKLNMASSFITSIAVCIDLGPSDPLRASPGPRILHRDDTMITIRPKAMAAVVVDM